MIAPSELWLVADLPEMLSDDGQRVDPHKVAGVIEAKVPEHWRISVQCPKHGPGPRSGASGLAQARTTSWAQALGHPQE